jgi:two-component system, OmpR family, sensor histidine kinase VicK
MANGPFVCVVNWERYAKWMTCKTSSRQMGNHAAAEAVVAMTLFEQNSFELSAIAAICLLVIGGYMGVFFAYLRRRRHLQIAVAVTDFQRALANDHCMVNIVDPSGIVTYANERFLGAMGYSWNDVIGKRIDNLYSHAMAEGRAAEIRAYVLQHGHWTGETELRCKNGALMWTQTTVRLAPAEFDNSGSMIVLRTDITEGKRAQSDRQLRNIFDRFPDEVYVFDANTRMILYMNQSAQSTVDTNDLSYLGLTLETLPGFLSSQQFSDVFEEMLANDEMLSTFCYTEGESAQEVSLQIIRDGDRSDHVIAMARDVTRQVHIERAKSEFVSTVSHELRTPLTSIKGALSLLSAGALGVMPAKATSVLTVAQRNTDRLILLINDLLDLEKIDAGQMDFARGTLDLGGLVREVVEMSEGMALSFGVTLATTSTSRFALVSGNKDRLAQVLSNLISNALKFSPVGGSVSVAISEEATCFRVSVADNGPGIPDDLKPRIFQRFAQGKQTNERKISGTGLGLSICKAILDRHDGVIGFDSSPQSGTVFHFDLPKLRLASAA